VIEIKRAGGVVAGARVRGAELLGLGPGLEVVFRGPHGVRGVERVILERRPLEQVELLEALHAVEIRVAAGPHLLKCLFRALLHTKPIHGDEHFKLLSDYA
jgi:hypothetical protein